MCVCVRACVRERERERVCVWVRERERERVRACVCVCQYVMLRLGGGSRERLAYYKDARLDKKQNNLKQTGNTPHTPKIKQSIFFLLLTVPETNT